MEGDESALPIEIVSLALSIRRQRIALAQDALAPRTGQHPVAGIEQHDAAALTLIRHQAHALDDGTGLRLPVEMDREKGERPAMDFAALAHGGEIGCDLSIREDGMAHDLGRLEILAGAQSLGEGEPGLTRRVVTAHIKALGTTIGDDAPVEFAKPEVEINGVGGQDDPEPAAGMGAVGLGRVRRAVHHGGIGGPPAHVACPLIEVAVDDLDGVEREIDAAVGARLFGQSRDGMGEFVDARAQADPEPGGDPFDFRRDGANLLGDDGEPGTLVARMRRLDQRVERQKLHAARDRLDRVEIRRGGVLQVSRGGADEFGERRGTHGAARKVSWAQRHGASKVYLAFYLLNLY
ncbi:hypothetical protein MMMDOFMJ_3073 [Methylobacterium gnaphalii]|nr:hypothetical protein MMMDOFMJ_3073 [Methylobacterium gnaphalii]